MFKNRLHASIAGTTATAASAASAATLSFLLTSSTTITHTAAAHGLMIRTGLDRDTSLLSHLLTAAVSLGHHRYSAALLSSHSPPHLPLYNAAIRASTSSGSPRSAVPLYRTLRLAGLRPDRYTFPFVLKALSRIPAALFAGKQVHGQIIGVGFASDARAATGLIQFYSGLGCLVDARKLFDEMPERDLIAWNAMVAGYAKVGDMGKAIVLFDMMFERNVITWTSMISGYVQANRPDEAIAMFQKMQAANVRPDEIAMLAALSACADLGALELGQWIHNYVDTRGLHKIVPLGNALIDMYAKSGRIEKAFDVFDSMECKSVITWTTMIASLAFHGLGFEALKVFSRMERTEVKPNATTFIAVLSACSHVRLVDDGWRYFGIMSSKYGIKPGIEHYGCMADLLGRAGYLREAQNLVDEMPFEANGAIWGSLLAAARIYGDMDLGERALRHLIELEPWNSGNYALLSNIYATKGKWNDVGKVRKLMRDRGLRKSPGGSSIEVNHTVHNFTAGDTSHPQHDKICHILCEINEQLKVDGYMPLISKEIVDYDES